MLFQQEVMLRQQEKMHFQQEVMLFQLEKTLYRKKETLFQKKEALFQRERMLGQQKVMLCQREKTLFQLEETPFRHTDRPSPTNPPKYVKPKTSDEPHHENGEPSWLPPRQVHEADATFSTGRRAPVAIPSAQTQRARIDRPRPQHRSDARRLAPLSVVKPPLDSQSPASASESTFVIHRSEPSRPMHAAPANCPLRIVQSVTRARVQKLPPPPALTNC
jgi:hypothetical protein